MRVGVIGGRARDHQRLLAAIGGSRKHLRCFKRREAALRDRLCGCDYVVVFPKDCAHSDHDTVKALLGHDRIMICPGGLDVVIAAVRQLLRVNEENQHGN